MQNQGVSKSSFITNFRYKRYTVYVIITLLLLLIPFVQINDNQILLLSFDKKVLHLFGIEYSTQEFYVMPFMLIILFVGIFLITVMGGRVWCGWSCPQTILRVIYRDLIQTKILKIRKKIADKQQPLNLDSGAKKLKFLLSLIMFSIVALIVSANLLFYFVPPYDFFSAFSDPSEHGILFGFWIVIAASIVGEVCFIAEKFCIYMCPYARVQSVLFDNNTLMSIYDTKRGGLVYNPSGLPIGIAPKKQNKANECTDCNHCVKVCPTHIDIRKGVQLECIHCLECVDACSNIMSKFNRPSLVSWSSPNAMAENNKPKLIRAKTIAYIVILVIIFAGLIIAGSNRKSMLLNITRTAELYSVRSSGAVDNAYKFVVQNTDDKEHRFAFEVQGELADKFEIIAPDHLGEKDFLISGKGEKIMVILLRAKENISKDTSSDYKQNITINAFALDDKERINIQKDTFFMYPSDENYAKKMEALMRK